MDGFDELLQAWGDALVCRREGIQASSGRAHALDRARDFAPVTVERFKACIVGRDGISRRAFMAGNGSAPGHRVTPAWAVDPVPCQASRSGPRRDHGGLPDHLRSIDGAVRDLAPLDPRAADCLREQYTGRGTQEDKAGRLGVTLLEYRAALKRGRGVLRRKLLPDRLTAAVTAG